MKNSVRFAILTAGIALVLAACGGSSSKETETQATEAEYMELGSVTKLGNYIGIKLTSEEASVTMDEVDAAIQSILDANPEYVEVERAAENGDRVNIDYVGLLDGEEFDGGSADNYYLTLGSGQFIDGFEDGLIGVKAGDKRSLNLTFPEDYYAELAGQDVVFEVTVNSVEEIVEAELDDDFVRRISHYSTVDQFRNDIIEELLEYKEDSVESQLQRDALSAVVDDSTFSLNQDYLEQNLEYNTDYIEYMASMYGMTLEEFVSFAYGMTMDEFDDYCRESIQEQMKQTLVVDEIAEKEDLEVTDEDLQYAADKLYEDVDYLKENEYDYLEANAIAYKVANFIIENADITVEEARADE